jgi:hypothetical protein
MSLHDLMVRRLIFSESSSGDKGAPQPRAPVARSRPWHLTLLPVLAIAACAQQNSPFANVQTGQLIGGGTEQVTNVQPVGGFLPNSALLYRGGSGEPALLYRNPSVVVSSYHQVLLEPVTVWSSSTSVFTNLPSAQRQALADKFHSDLYQAVSKRCQMATTAAAGTLRLRFALVDATAPNAVLNTVATYTPYASSAYDAASFLFNKGVGYFAGSATVEGYATDASTGTLVWQAMDKRSGTTSMAENTLDTKLDINHAFTTWSDQLASRLAQVGVCRG